MYIYDFDGHAAFGPLAHTLRARALFPEHRLFASLFTIGEMLVKPVREGDAFQEAKIRALFRSPAVALLPYPAAAVSIFANLRAHHAVKGVDALHLACAAHAGMDLFVTNDRKLTQITVPGIGRVVDMNVDF